MEVIISDAKSFKTCVDAISTLIDEGVFEFGANGLTLRAMDPSQIAMVDFVLPKKAFEKFEAGDEKLGMNLEDLAKVLARVRPDDKLSITLDDSKSRLVLTFKGGATRKFVVPLLDLGFATPKEPNIEFESTAKFNGTFLKESLKDTHLVSSHVILSTSKDAFVIEAVGDKGEVNIITEKKDDQLFDFDVKKDCRAMFPLEYLNDLLKNADASTNVEVAIRSDAPLRVRYGIGEATITYFLAPRIETQ